MERKEIPVAAEDSGKRIDVYLSEQLGKSRSYIQKLMKEDQVWVNEQIVKPNYKLNPEDCISVQEPEPKELTATPEDLPLDIVYEDEDLLVINKQAGISVHPAPGNESGTLVNALLFHVKNLSGINGVLRPGIVHRIDKDTTGLLVVAKNNDAHQFLSEELKDHRIQRTYLALVKGNLAETTGTIRTQIARNPNDRKKMAVVKQNGREAITHFEVLERFEKYTLLRVKLETGRTHQIRVHMHYIHHPILGDPVYGFSQNEFGLKRQALHAAEIEFVHPKTRNIMTFQAPLPDDFQKILDTLRRRRS